MKKIFFCFLLLGIHQINLLGALSDEDRARELITRQILVHFVDLLMETSFDINNDIDEEEINQDVQTIVVMENEISGDIQNQDIPEAAICEANTIVVGQIGYNLSNNQEQNNTQQSFFEINNNLHLFLNPEYENNSSQNVSDRVIFQENQLLLGAREERLDVEVTREIILTEEPRNNSSQAVTSNQQIDQTGLNRTNNNLSFQGNNRAYFDCTCVLQ